MPLRLGKSHRWRSIAALDNSGGAVRESWSLAQQRAGSAEELLPRMRASAATAPPPLASGRLEAQAGDRSDDHAEPTIDRRDRLRRNGTHTHTTARAALRGGHTVTTRVDADHNPRDESQPVSDEHVAADMSAPSIMMNRERRLTIMTATEINGGRGHPGRRADARNQTPATDRGCQVVGAHPRCSGRRSPQTIVARPR
jgi:hypothetical protein